jgi:hypothetical protein
MTNLADTFPFTGTIPAVGFPAYVGATPPANPAVGSIWFNPTTGTTQVYTASGWVAAGGGGAAGSTTLDALTDVDAVGAVDGDTLVYDGRTSMWMAIPPDHDAGRY